MNTMTILLLLHTLVFPLYADNVVFTASADKTTVGTGEQFTLSFTVSCDNPNAVRNFKAPSLSTNFYVMSGPNQSTSMQFINGQMSGSISYNYTLQPRDVGKFTVGSATIEYDGKEYRSQPITIEVVKGVTKPQQPSQAPDVSQQIGESLFLRALVDKSKVIQGKPVVVTFKIYTRVNVASYTMSKVPNVPGFWGEDLEVPKQIATSKENVNGKQYATGTIKKMLLFPTRSGTLEIDPLEVECAVQVENKRRSNDPFEQFFDDPFFKRYSTVKYKVKSDPVKIAVSPLPSTNVPGSFKGAVGKFTMNTSLDKSETKTNEPVTLKVMVSGTGNIKLLDAPAISIPTDFEKYDPKVSENIARQNNTVSGSKTFEYLMIPRHPGVQKIPAIEFSFFDLGKREYVTLRSSEFTLNVTKGSAEITPALSGISKEDVKLLAQDIRFIKTGDGSLRKRGEYFYKSTGFVIVSVLPLVALIGLVLYRQRTERLRGDVVSLKMRRANRVAIKRLSSSKVSLDRGESEQFYAEVSKSLWGYLSDRLSIPPAEITLDIAIEKLKQKNVSQEVVDKMKSCVEVCDFARFAPSSSSPEEMRKMYQESKESIIALEHAIRG